MKKFQAFRLAVVAAAIAGPLTAAMATNGYFSHGYGIKSKSMGGVGIALPQDAMAAATNPAGAVNVGNRVDFGLDLFMPDRTSTFGANAPGTVGVAAGAYQSGKREFLIPEFGYNKMLTNDSAFALVVYGNGGMNTSYGKPLTQVGTKNTSSNVEQLFVAPTYAKKIGKHSFGASLNLIRQTFEVNGIGAFAQATQSIHPDNVNDKGQDESTGYGVKVGWSAEVSPMVTVGATYQSRSRMTKFSKYKGLLAEEGGFDIPESYGLGIAVKANPKTTVAFDITQINYSSIKALGNQGTMFPQAAVKMGLDAGAGFGWTDMTVFKLGLAYDYSKDLTLRAGFNHGKNPLTKNNTYFNILAPATTETHYTLGATWTLANKSELTLSYMYAPEVVVKGNSAGTGQPASPGFDIDLKMSQTAIGVAYGWKF